MGLARREETQTRFPNRREVRFEPDALAEAVRTAAPEVDFATLLGSARDGVVAPYSDIDVAVYFHPDTHVTFEVISRIMTAVEATVRNRAEADVSILNSAHEVLRFEALRGRFLFVRPEAEERFVEFYTRTCREYDDWCFLMERQRRHQAAVEAV